MSAPRASSAALAGRVALVTGASRGLGLAIARRLAAHGLRVLLLASPRSQEALSRAVAQIVAAGGQAAAVVADLADPAARAGLIARAEGLLGPVDILVNNAAGISAYAPPSRIDRGARQAMWELNLEAPIDLTQQALPGMRARGWGRIVNLSSEMARQPPIPYPGPAKFVHALALYGVSKAALERYTEALAAELQGSGLTANALYPHKIALTEGAEAVARQTAVQHPDWLEPVELVAEAAWLLIVGGQSGTVASSRAILQRAQAPLHALDGVTVIGDATTLATLPPPHRG
ncbi:MAG TPA: SDR family oxidoreductase [Solimonas sp.]|nr:SDR family oxidoreductase [Solimonas sp.]